MKYLMRVDAIDIHIHLASLDMGEASLALLSTYGNRIMTTLQDIQTALAKTAANATAEKAEVSTALATLTDKITALQETIKSGTGVTTADLDDLLNKITAIDTQVSDISVPAVPQTTTTSAVVSDPNPVA